MLWGRDVGRSSRLVDFVWSTIERQVQASQKPLSKFEFKSCQTAGVNKTLRQGRL
jgi:hypothetical protein